MDLTPTLILTVVSAVGGGTLLKIGEKIFGNNKIKELSDIISQMRKELDTAYRRIEKLEQVNTDRLGVEERNVILEVAMAQSVGCENGSKCPIRMKLDELELHENRLNKAGL
jgi:hypothetical protein